MSALGFDDLDPDPLRQLLLWLREAAASDLSNCAKDRVDRGIVGYDGSCFYEVVYVQGASFIDRLRKDVGYQRFWAAVRDYWNSNQFKFGGTVELLESLRVAADQANVQDYSRYSSRFPRYY